MDHDSILFIIVMTLLCIMKKNYIIYGIFIISAGFCSLTGYH